MYIGESFTREIIVVPLHEVSEADMKELLWLCEGEFEIERQELYRRVGNGELSEDMLVTLYKIFDAGIADRIQFNEGNG